LTYLERVGRLLYMDEYDDYGGYEDLGPRSALEETIVLLFFLFYWVVLYFFGYQLAKEGYYLGLRGGEYWLLRQIYAQFTTLCMFGLWGIHLSGYLKPETDAKTWAVWWVSVFCTSLAHDAGHNKRAIKPGPQPPAESPPSVDHKESS